MKDLGNYFIDEEVCMRRNCFLTLFVLFLLVSCLYARFSADNPVLDIRLQKENLTFTENAVCLEMWIEIKSVDFSSRQIFSMQDALVFDKQLRPLVTSVNVSDWYFSVENYRILQNYTPQQGVLEFHVLHLDGRPFQAVTGDDGMWVKLGRVQVTFTNKPDLNGKIRFYQNTPRFNVRAKKRRLPGTETIHNLEHLTTEIEVSRPHSIMLDHLHAGSENGTVRLDWHAADFESYRGVYVYRAARQDGPFEKISPLLPMQQQNVYTDESPGLKNTCFYRLGFLDGDANIVFSETVDVDIELPAEYQLDQNYPNPFNPETCIPFALKESGRVKMSIYNLKGQRVRTLVDQHLEAGRHSVVWDGLNETGGRLSSGMYIYRIRVNHFTKTRKMQLMR